MGSTLSLGNPRASPQNARAPVMVWWDIENCMIPGDIDAAKVGERIRSSLSDLGYRGYVTITAVAANNERVPHHIRMRLEEPRNGVTFYSCGDDKQVSDTEIKRQMTQWKNANNPPCNAMLISGDEDYLQYLDDLKTMGFNILVAYRPEASTREMRRVAPTKWEWRRLLKLRNKPEKNKKTKTPQSHSRDPSPERKIQKGNRFLTLRRTQSSRI